MIPAWLPWLIALAVLIIQVVLTSFALGACSRCRVQGDLIRPATYTYVLLSGAVWVWIVYLLLSYTFQP